MYYKGTEELNESSIYIYIYILISYLGGVVFFTIMDSNI